MIPSMMEQVNDQTPQLRRAQGRLCRPAQLHDGNVVRVFGGGRTSIEVVRQGEQADYVRVQHLKAVEGQGKAVEGQDKAVEGQGKAVEGRRKGSGRKDSGRSKIYMCVFKYNEILCSKCMQRRSR